MALRVFKTGSQFDEVEIFERISKGDEKALEVVYSKYYRMMTKLVVTNSGTEEEARDVYQDALVVFWQKARSGETGADFQNEYVYLQHLPESVEKRVGSEKEAFKRRKGLSHINRYG